MYCKVEDLCRLYVRSCYCVFFFFKQKTAYEMRISDWSSDVCSSDLGQQLQTDGDHAEAADMRIGEDGGQARPVAMRRPRRIRYVAQSVEMQRPGHGHPGNQADKSAGDRKSTRLNSSH